MEVTYFFISKNRYIFLAKSSDFPCLILFPQYRKIPKIRPVFSPRKDRALNKVSKKENNSAFLFLLFLRLTPSTTANVRFLDEDVVLSGYHVPAQVSGRTVPAKLSASRHLRAGNQGWILPHISDEFVPYRALNPDPISLDFYILILCPFLGISFINEIQYDLIIQFGCD